MHTHKPAQTSTASMHLYKRVCPSIGPSIRNVFIFGIRETARFFTSEEGMKREGNVKGREEEKGGEGTGGRGGAE